jgi:hypothetical protein
MTPKLLQKKMKHRKINIPEDNILENTFLESLGLGIAVVRLDRKLATLWNDLLPDNQRSVGKASFRRICEALEGGWWNQFNGETIKFDRNGSLVDGQHRVLAVLRTGVDMIVPVWYGCSADSISTIDTGKSRSLGDVLKINGFSNTNQAASVVSNIMSYSEYGYIQKASPCIARGLEWAKNNSADLYKSIKAAQVARTYLPVSIGGTLYYFYSKVDSGGAAKMFAEFKAGTNRCNAIEMFKDTISRIQKKSGVTMSAQWKMSVATKAFNAYFIGDDIKGLRWNKSERIPAIVDIWL